MNKLIERLEGLKSELYKEMVASGYRNDDLEDTVHVVLENALCLVQSMCEAGEVVVLPLKFEIMGADYLLSKTGKVYSIKYLTEAEAAECERRNKG